MRSDIKNAADWVLRSSGGAAIKHLFGLDTKSYSWVKDYVRDKKIRTEIKQLQDEIVKTNALPIHKGGLRLMFETRIKQINQFRIQQMVTHLDEVQKRDRPLINENMINAWKLNGALFNPVLINLSSNDIDKIFSQLQAGVPQEDIEKTAIQLREKITGLETTIDQELSPRERWFHREDGRAHPYPQGCRWRPFVETWEKVVSRFDGNVDIEGHALKTSDEFAAYGLLELGNARKVTPLREPLE